MSPTIAGIAVLRGFGAERTLLPEADGFELVAWNAERNKRIFGGGGPAVTQGEVIFSGATFIAMPFNRNDEIGVHLEDRFQSAGVTLHNGLIFAANLALVVVKMEILHLFRQNFLDSGLSGSGSR